MQFIKSVRFVLITRLLFTAHLVTADAKQIQLPPEIAKLPEADLVGYKLAMQKCTICHSVDYIQFQAPGLNQAQWTSEVAKMKHSYGAALSASEIKSIGAYLAVVYGTAKATDSEVLAVSVVEKPNVDAQQVELDVQALLETNGCLGCHALDAKLLGPSFKEIAVKYKTDAQAQVILARSIQQGGAGKWGQIPMPPIAGLNDKQAEALAKFIMAQ